MVFSSSILKYKKSILVFFTLILIGFSSVSNAGFWDTFIPDLFGEKKTAEVAGDTLFGDTGQLTTFRGVLSDLVHRFSFIQIGGDYAKKLGSGNPSSGLFADQFLGVLIIIGLIMTLIKSLAQGGKGMGQDLISLVTTYAIISILLVNYSDLFVNGVKKFFEVLTTSFLGNAGGSVEDNFLDTVTGLFNILVLLFKKIITNLMHINPIDIFAGVIVAIPLLFTAYMVFQTALRVFILYFLGDMLAGIGLALGPVFLAFGAIEYTRGYVSSWFDFLMGSFAIKLISVIIITLFGSVLLNTITQATGHASETSIGDAYTGSSIMIDAFLTFVLAATFKELMEMAPMIAGSLFSGMKSGGKDAHKNAVDTAKTMIDKAKGAVGI